MRVSCLFALLLPLSTDAFAPLSSRTAHSSTTRRAFGVDPSHFVDALHHLPTLSVADAIDTVAANVDAVAQSVDAVAQNVDPEVVQEASNNGWFGFLTMPIEGLLQLIHSAIAAVAGSGNAWGISIIVLTLLIKVVTFPLTKTQLESTSKMQAMQPAIKEIQNKYQSNPEVMNQKMAEFYQTNDINPLAGCLPSLVQIPVFIGLYRAVLDLAKINQLDEPFLFLPNLEGPTYGADPATASDWILKGWVDGAPSLGWEDTLSFLILPVFLVISQFVSMELMQPKTDDPAQQQSNVILKILPVMIGWFALNVPAALSVYWVTNNIVTTALSLYIRNSVKVDAPKTPGGAAAATIDTPVNPVFSPPREKPAGFGSEAPVGSEGVKPLTLTMDAEILEEAEDAAEEVTYEPPKSNQSASKKKKRKGKKKKN